jgi:hypothetical protein
VSSHTSFIFPTLYYLLSYFNKHISLLQSFSFFSFSYFPFFLFVFFLFLFLSPLSFSPHGHPFPLHSPISSSPSNSLPQRGKAERAGSPPSTRLLWSSSLSSPSLSFSTPRVMQSQTSGLGAVAAVMRSSFGSNSGARSCNGAKSSAGKPSARPLLPSRPILLYMASLLLPPPVHTPCNPAEPHHTG